MTSAAGGAIFGKLKALGVEYVFANTGTDFLPIIEGLIEARERGIELPQAVTVPHEHVAVGMAHGYTDDRPSPGCQFAHQRRAVERCHGCDQRGL